MPELTKERIEILGKLLRKLKQLKKENRVFGLKGSKEAPETDFYLTSIAGIVYNQLIAQIDFVATPDANSTSLNRLEEHIENFEEFLAIFEEKESEETVAVPVDVLEEVLRVACVNIHPISDKALSKRLYQIYNKLQPYKLKEKS